MATPAWIEVLYEDGPVDQLGCHINVWQVSLSEERYMGLTINVKF
jgi:hypothetical protein